MAEAQKKGFDIKEGTLRKAIGAKVGEKIKGNARLMAKVRKLARGGGINKKRAMLFLKVFLPASNK